MTPDVFLSVLKGDERALSGKGNGKFLNTDKDSKVFIFFTDHGAPGLLAFPSAMLFADDLMKALHFMNENKRYKKLVFYVEACEAGSMFEGLLPPNIDVYALTASNAHESSFGTYCYPDDVVNGEHLGSCLGDEFSVNWMEDADAHDLQKETLKD